MTATQSSSNRLMWQPDFDNQSLIVLMRQAGYNATIGLYNYIRIIAHVYASVMAVHSQGILVDGSLQVNLKPLFIRYSSVVG